MLVAQIRRWTALLQAEERIMAASEQQVSRCHRERAEVNGERSLLQLDIEDLTAQVQAEEEEHNMKVTNLQERLRSLKRIYANNTM